jgi:xanthine/uracil permease
MAFATFAGIILNLVLPDTEKQSEEQTE